MALAEDDDLADEKMFKLLSSWRARFVVEWEDVDDEDAAPESPFVPWPCFPCADDDDDAAFDKWLDFLELPFVGGTGSAGRCG